MAYDPNTGERPITDIFICDLGDDANRQKLGQRVRTLMDAAAQAARDDAEHIRDLEQRLATAERERDSWQGEAEAAMDAANQLRPTLHRAEDAEQRCDAAFERAEQQAEAASVYHSMWFEVNGWWQKAERELRFQRERAEAAEKALTDKMGYPSLSAQLAAMLMRAEAAEAGAAAMKAAITDRYMSEAVAGIDDGPDLCDNCGEPWATHAPDCWVGQALASVGGAATLARLKRLEAFAQQVLSTVAKLCYDGGTCRGESMLDDLRDAAQAALAERGEAQA